MRADVAATIAGFPIVGVVRTASDDEAAVVARRLLAGGIQLVEITFTVPGATRLVRELIADRGGDGPPWIGMGTVTDGRRAEGAADAGAEFVVSPNAAAEVAATARRTGLFLVIGALTPTEIVSARALGADLVKVYPLPPVGGPEYLAAVRQPLGDVPMLAAGGFGIEEIPAYRRAGAAAFGIGAPLLAADAAGDAERMHRAMALARGRESE